MFNFFGAVHKRVAIPEHIMLKDNARVKLIVDDEGQLVANGSGNTLPVDRSYRLLSGINIQMIAKGKRNGY